MRTSGIWDKLAALSPTRDAAVATSGGDSWEPAIPAPAGLPHFKAPPKLVPVDPKWKAADRALIGAKIGRFTVLGVIAGTNPKKKVTWLCRCECGDYEGRKAAALKAADPVAMQCYPCWRLERLRKATAAPVTRARHHSEAAGLDALAARERQRRQA